MGESKRRRQQQAARTYNRVELTDNPDINVMAGRLEPQLLSDLKAEIARQRAGTPPAFNNGLAGMIKEEYLFDVSRLPGLAGYIQEMYETYAGHFGLYKDKLSCLSHLWINVQKKHEFNPLHNHTGAVSFVIWVQIPFDIGAEQALFPQATMNVTSNFQFVYPGKTEHIAMMNFPVAQDWEGMILMWPSWLHHTVYPFYTSDDVRISLAGNIYVLGENYKSRPEDDPDEIIRQSLQMMEQNNKGE